MRFSVAFFLLAAACSADLTPPSGARIRCTSDAHCPASFECKSQLGMCVKQGGDDEPPRVEAATLETPVAGPLRPIRVRLTVSEDLSSAPVVLLGTPARQALALESADGRSYVFTYTPVTTDAEGNWPLLADLTDAAGNPARDVSLGSVTLDHTTPGIVGPSELYQGEPGNPLDRVRAIRDGARYSLYFSTTEPIDGEPIVRGACPSGDVFLERYGDTSNLTFFVYEIVLEPSDVVADGSCPLHVTLADFAANAASEVPLTGVVLRIDRTPPDAATAIDLARLLHLRAPWGALQTEGRAGQFLARADLGRAADPETQPLEAAAFVAGGDEVLAEARIYAQGTGGVLLGISRPVAEGWDVPRLVGNTSELWVALVDAAGNESSRRLVPQVEWVSTLGGKRPGSTFENPAELRTTSMFDATLQQRTGEALEPSAADIMALTSEGDGPLQRTGSGRWTRLQVSASTPPMTYGAAITYDSVSGNVYAFGGNSADVGDQLWQWNGTTGRWLRLDAESGQRPPARGQAGLCADTRRGRIVVHGGGISATYDDTWEWDLAQKRWIDVTPAEPGPPRRAFPFVFDDSRGACVLVGGDYYGEFNDVWEWNGVAWDERETTSTPPATRQEHGVVYDSAREVLVLFGGSEGKYNEACTADAIPDPNQDPPWYTCYYGDTWEWDGATAQWAKVAARDAGPSPRRAASMAYDAANRKTVLFAGEGLTPNYKSDLWEWDGEAQAWSPRTQVNPQPGLRYGAPATYDVLRERMIVYRGATGSSSLTDLWEWNGATGTWKSRPSSAASAPSRGRTTIMSETTTGGVLVYGGYNSSSGGASDLWRFDAVAVRWEQETPTGGSPPTSEGYPAVVFVSSRNSVVFLEDAASAAGTAPMWEYNLTTNAWGTRTQSGDVPYPRGQTSIAYDAFRDRVVLFGGVHYSLASCPDGSAAVDNTCYYRDLREWNPATGAWTLRSTSGPSSRYAHRLTYDSDRRRVLIIGGCQGGTYCSYNDDSWEWDGSGAGSFTPLAVAGGAFNPGARFRHAVTYDAGRKAVVVYSGYPESPGMNEWDPVSQAWFERVGYGDVPEPDDSQGIGYDPSTGHIVVFGGSDHPADLWTWDGGAERGPAALYSVPLAAAGMDAGLAPSSVYVRAVAGGVGYSERTPVPGVALTTWAAGRWRELARDEVADTAAPAELAALIDDPSLLHRVRYGEQQTLTFALAPLAPNGTSPTPAAVALDVIEVRVRYSR